MAQVKSKHTTPEMNVRRAAHALGLRFRLHGADLPGTPDLVFRRWRTALFVNGCFWHSHHCERARVPKTNVDYWTKKLQRNELRDKKASRLLKKSGYRRSFPTAPVRQTGVNQATAYADVVSDGKPLVQQLSQPVVAYVATGSVTVRVGDNAPQVVEEGKSFYAPGGATTQISAKGGTAKVVTFQLRS
jgi:DNA mismatch endonuclease (patch repair protein)